MCVYFKINYKKKIQLKKVFTANNYETVTQMPLYGTSGYDVNLYLVRKWGFGRGQWRFGIG